MARRLALALIATLVVLTQPASAAEGEAPAVGTPMITPDSAASVSVSVLVDSHNAETTVQVEYVTAGAYRGAKVPGAATTVTIATTPASAAGPVTVTGQVTGLKPASSYRMRVRASNTGGETFSTSITVTTPAAPKAGFKAKVGADTTRITKLTVTGLSGGESVKVTCKTATKGCPFRTKTVADLAPGTAKLSSLLKAAALEPGAKVVVQVSAYGVRLLSTLTLVVRDGKKPKVKRK